MSRLDNYRKQAKELLKAHRAGEPGVAGRFALNHPRFRDKQPRVAEPAKLADAQLVVAREARFESWPKLKHCLEAVEDSPDAERFESAADAVVAGDVEALERLLDEDPSLATRRSPREHQATLLHYSASNGIEDHRQRTPTGAVAVAELLIARGARIDVTTESYGGGGGSTPLVALVTSGHPVAAGMMDDLVRAFARSGQSLDGVDDDGLPISLALQFRNVSAARTLTEAGARVDNAAVAAGIGREDAIDALVDDGRPPLALAGAFLRTFQGAADAESTVQFALLFAATAGETAVARKLLDRGVDANCRLHHGLTPLHEAARGGHLDTVQTLVEAGARVDLRDNQHRATPVGWAAHADRDAVVGWFVDHCPVDPIDLVQLGRIDLVRSRVKDREESGHQQAPGLPLWAAAAAGDVELVRLLLERGADRSATDPDGKTSLDWALELGHDEIAGLLQKG